MTKVCFGFLTIWITFLFKLKRDNSRSSFRWWCVGHAHVAAIKYSRQNMLALDILQASMESQPRNRSNAIIRAANVDRFRQVHICRHILKENISRHQRLCRSSQDPNSFVYRLTEPFVRAEREKTEQKQLLSIHIDLQRAATKHHRKPNCLNPCIACWNQVDQIGIGWIWELSFRPCSSFSLSPFLLDN